MFYLFSKSNSSFLPPFTHPVSSPLPFLDSVFPLLVCPSLLPQPWSSLPHQLVVLLAFHTEGRLNDARRQKHIEQRLAAWAVQIKQIHYKDETVFFRFLLTASARLAVR